jgi:hypothetical protein
MYWFSFAEWSNAAGIFFVSERLYTLRGSWTPVVKVSKRYPSWFGYFRKSTLAVQPDRLNDAGAVPADRITD